MAKKNHAMRYEDREWTELVIAAKQEGTTVTEVTKAFHAWWLRKPGAKLPKRVDPEAGATDE
jgi:hypothetical protein